MDGPRAPAPRAPSSEEAGLHSRQEWETRASGPAPDLAALRELDGIDPEWAGLLADPALGQADGAYRQGKAGQQHQPFRHHRNDPSRREEQ